MACNSTGAFIGISLAAILVPHLRGWKLLLVPLLLPIGDAIGYAATALPVWIVINTPVPFWVSQLGGLLTFVFAGLVVHGLSLIIAADSPLKSRAGINATLALRPSAA